MKKAFFGLMAMAVLIPAIGCGDSSKIKDKNPITPSLSVSIDQEEATIIAGKTLELPITVLRVAIKGEIKTNVTDLPEGVTAIVNLPDEKDEGTLTLTATKEAKGKMAAKITVEGGGKTNTATLMVIVQAAEGGKKKIDDGKKKPDDGKKKIDDGKKKPDDGKKKIDDGKKKPDDGKKKIDDGKKKPDDGKKKIDDGKKKPDDAKKKPVDSKKTKTSALPRRDDEIERVVIAAFSSNQPARFLRRPTVL